MTGSKNNMNRRQFLQITSGSAAAMMLSGIPLNAEETKRQRPNILWV
ncbi:twin-arginine translocation signal domain-containing protein, partial [bacterium]|nr:twin-arginine translocation signal domain-containing protein [bacterium]